MKEITNIIGLIVAVVIGLIIYNNLSSVAIIIGLFIILNVIYLFFYSVWKLLNKLNEWIDKDNKSFEIICITAFIYFAILIIISLFS